jgi:hypothetical protein
MSETTATVHERAKLIASYLCLASEIVKEIVPYTVTEQKLYLLFRSYCNSFQVHQSVVHVCASRKLELTQTCSPFPKK